MNHQFLYFVFVLGLIVIIASTICATLVLVVSIAKSYLKDTQAKSNEQQG